MLWLGASRPTECQSHSIPQDRKALHDHDWLFLSLGAVAAVGRTLPAEGPTRQYSRRIPPSVVWPQTPSTGPPPRLPTRFPFPFHFHSASIDRKGGRWQRRPEHARCPCPCPPIPSSPVSVSHAKAAFLSAPKRGCTRSLGICRKGEDVSGLGYQRTPRGLLTEIGPLL
jgi:hypothetical protein